MQPGSGGVPTRQRGFPKCPAVLGWVAAGQNGFLQFAEEPEITTQLSLEVVFLLKFKDKVQVIIQFAKRATLVLLAKRCEMLQTGYLLMLRSLQDFILFLLAV